MVGIRFKRLAAVLIVLIICSGCSIRMTMGGYKNRYFISVYYKPQEQSIFGTQKLSYKNTEDTKLNNIYFHIYPNAFRHKETSPMIGDIRDNYPGGFNPGQIDIINIWVNSQSVKWEIEGKDKTLLNVELLKPLGIGEEIVIRIDFQEKIPSARTDFGSYNKVACFENWYPVLCVYDHEGWHKEPSCRMGEANFSEVSDYTVEIDLPENEVVASTGTLIREKKMDNGRKIITLEADNVRDFTWISSSRYKTVSKRHNGVEVKSYFINEDKVKGVAALDFGVRAIEFFTEIFGEYPYDSLNIVETYLYGGAMEYPLLTSIGEQFYKYSDEKVLEAVIAHEIAHQWWYVVVGNNEYREPWLDEALATYSEAMYFEKYYGVDMMKQKINTKVGLARFDRVPIDSMDKFRTGSEYNLIVYMKGAYILDEFRRKVGDEKFFEILRSYYSNYKFKNATTLNFLEVIKEVCGTQALEYFNLRLSGN